MATVYVIFCENKYFYKHAYRGDLVWVDDFTEAKLYASEKSLNKHLNMIANLQSNRYGGPGPWPEVHEFEMEFIKKIDHSEQFKKNRERAAKAMETRQKNANVHRARDAEARVKDLEWQLEQERKRLEELR